MPALPSSLISPALEQLRDLPASDRALLAGQCPGLAEHLARVPDPRDPRGVRHPLTSLLLAAIAAVLAGARSFTAVGEWVADAPPQVLAALGIRHDPLAGRSEPPDEATIRRVLGSVDAAALEPVTRYMTAMSPSRPLRLRHQIARTIVPVASRVDWKTILPHGWPPQRMPIWSDAGRKATSRKHSPHSHR